jgi:hypothetical protein
VNDPSGKFVTGDCGVTVFAVMARTSQQVTRTLESVSRRQLIGWFGVPSAAGEAG